MSSNPHPWQLCEVIDHSQRLWNRFQYWTGNCLMESNDDPNDLRGVTLFGSLCSCFSRYIGRSDFQLWESAGAGIVADELGRFHPPTFSL